MKRFTWSASWISLGLLAAAGAAVAGPGTADLRQERGFDPELVPVPAEPRAWVEVWTDVGEGSVVRPGRFVDVYVRAARSSYLAVVDIDTRGRARLLWPVRRGDDGFARGGRLVAIPGPYADYRLAVTGPSGVERIVVLASDRPLVGRWREALEWSEPRYEEHGAMGVPGYPAPGSRRGERLEPQLVPVPVHGGFVERAETWFEVESRGRRRPPRY
jgi:hypothetical protein